MLAAVGGLLLVALLVSAGLGRPLGRGSGEDLFRHRVQVGGVLIESMTALTEAEDMAAEMAAYLDDLAQVFGHRRPEARIRLLPSRRLYQRFGQRYLPGFRAGMDFCYATGPGIVYGFTGAGVPVRAKLRHELFHHYAAHGMPDLALWANEGLAEIFEDVELRPDGTLVLHGDLQRRRLATALTSLRRESATLRTMHRLDATRFYSSAESERSYGVAYGVMWYILRHGLLQQGLQQGVLQLDREDVLDFLADTTRHTGTQLSSAPPVAADLVLLRQAVPAMTALGSARH